LNSGDSAGRREDVHRQRQAVGVGDRGGHGEGVGLQPDPGGAGSDDHGHLGGHDFDTGQSAFVGEPAE